jgi:hypothetical protein
MASRTSTLLLTFAASIAIAQKDSPEERAAHWREDLRVLTAAFSAKGTTVDFERGITSRGQKDFEKLYPHFAADMEALDADLPKLSDGEVVLRLMKIIASAKVAHNLVQQPVGLGFFQRLPLSLVWYSDGLAIMGASEEYMAAQGARVLKIGDKTPDQVVANLSPYIAHENDIWLRANAVELVRPRIVLQHIGLADADGQVTLTLQKSDGSVVQMRVKTADPRIKRIPATEALQLPTPLFRSRPNEFYWHRYLEDSATLYVQYNQCANDPKLKFSDFAAKVLADADSHPVKRVVIDMRGNSGGDSRVIRPLKIGLNARRGKVGPVYVLIGPGTFSSGTDNAIELHKDLHATLVGEPTGGKPSSYGEVKYVTLPNSKLKVQFTSKWFGSEKDSEPTALVPDLSAPRTIADALAGRDPALEAALRQ